MYGELDFYTAKVCSEVDFDKVEEKMISISIVLMKIGEIIGAKRRGANLRRFTSYILLEFWRKPRVGVENSLKWGEYRRRKKGLCYEHKRALAFE